MLGRLQRLDFARLAGVSSVLGIDLDQTSGRIVVLKKSGNPLDKYKARFSADAPLSLTFPHGSGAQEKGRRVKEILLAHRVKIPHCVATVRSAGVRTVSVTVPTEVQDFGDWIAEHAAKILKLPVALSELELRWDILEATPHGTTLDITFVRKADLSELREVISGAGLTLLALSAGARDVLNSLFVTDPAFGEKDITVACCEGERLTLVSAFHARRKATISMPNGLDEATLKRLEADELLWAGARSFAESYPQDKELKPYNLTPDYALATGLAFKGFLPELNRVDFLSEAEREANRIALWQAAFRRTAIVLGSLLIVLLALVSVASFAIESAREGLEEDVSSSRATVVQVAALKDRVNALEAQLVSSHSGISRENLAGLLHQLASAVPPPVRADHLEVTLEATKAVRIAIKAAAKSREAVTAFLKNLQQAGFSEVTLIRLSATEGQEGATALVKAELEATAPEGTLP